MPELRRLIIAITGATGAIYALRILERLKTRPEWETHLVVSDAGALTVQHELGMKRRKLHAMADSVHGINDIGAAIASGAFKTEGMIIAPCSMKTLSAIAHGYSDNLISRAADVVLKERRRLVLLPREAPLSLSHLRNMISVTEMGGIIYPPLPAFYTQPSSVDDIVAETTGRVLSLVGLDANDLFTPWRGLNGEV